MILALVGGAIIGIAATLLWWSHGKVAGISNILSGAIDGENDHRRWFLLGLICAGAIGTFVHRSSIGTFASLPIVVLGGFLVGFGAKLGSGCTSGHGVCGISRFSKRSIVATLTFMATGIGTVWITEHVL